MKAEKGRLTYIRETHRVFDPDEHFPAPCEEPPPWGCAVVMLIIAVVMALGWMNN